MRKLFCAVAIAAMLPGCASMDQLGRMGRAPKLTPAEPVTMPATEPSLGMPSLGTVQALTPGAPPPAGTSSASLFRPGAGSFLGDQRASRTGDILTIRIQIQDKAEVGNTTTRQRAGSENASVASLLGLEKLLPNSIDPSNLASTSSNSKSSGGGNISRSETINMTMSAIVTGVFPNGNLAIRGRQEVRVNYELRELVVTGIVRPQDIARDNSILHSQIAEARISYGGRGQLSEAQQARWGQQIYDALFPF
ncbi:flagellar basal body L-ring protein FlgH [Stakelama sp. CBK3Z-3]|uniref:Flagellar L-ring protein n=1 Tax=Stakelama flava TaxID=2860338 RepID=A0ABS6XJS2_9SPHN|nr:flagellar basal body L-ring protein FlgH [Stakelama flava]MBW4330458.1 flagellar basal body L-ring protein FlgH [Stakelama flava]